MDEKKLKKKLKQLSDSEKIAIIDYATLGMQGEKESRNVLSKIFGEIDVSSMADYYIIQREAYNSMSESAQIHVDNETKMALEYNPPLHPNPEKVFNKLAILRINAGLTQKELSIRSGVNIRQIQRYESSSSDTGNMTLKNAIAISEALECDVKSLV